MIKTIVVSVKQWLFTGIIAGVALFVFLWFNEGISEIFLVPVCCMAGLIAAIPAFIGLLLTLPFLKKMQFAAHVKWQLFLLLLLLACIPYGVVAAVVIYEENISGYIIYGLEITSALWLCNIFAVIINYQQINYWIINKVFQTSKNQHFKTNKTNTTMTSETNSSNEQSVDQQPAKSENSYTRILIKTGITAGLILAMLIPASYIGKLVDEREQRHLEVVKEVSEKWASPQTIITPYLCIPYLKHGLNDSGKGITLRDQLMIPAKELNVNASMQPEVRKRSIYEVLLYRSNIDVTGKFVILQGADIKPDDILFNDARLCIGITDLQGVEEKVNVTFNNNKYDLEPGLPVKTISGQGLSVPVQLSADKLNGLLSFAMTIKLKGSGMLHFLPLSEESSILIHSTWPNPSFDGNILPNERDLGTNGFSAKWRFNKANMPLISQLSRSDSEDEKLSFGVSMIQPADQYAKTNRSVKYAILFIGLSFAMFFITELVQTKPVHPVQYILIGLALIIFYTLLLSIGEFTGFNIAYGIAAGSTIMLIAFYSVQLFGSIAIGSLLGAFLGMLYGYIYVLIQLEDTALLAGSIGLFILLALAMHFSRKIKWYPRDTPVTAFI